MFTKPLKHVCKIFKVCVIKSVGRPRFEGRFCKMLLNFHRRLRETFKICIESEFSTQHAPQLGVWDM